ncbi:hypothetical protein CAPTEDRAFT_194160 [Capitella teleta]|uniref:Uncharacterized protein n=1 Tax=Capitella teleta TaxID=283909 RepID=R7V0C5_CAPTE|nr:hypothetical protein CAPTEDRAFT_207973 [Capitella teleta]ELU09116.1 hypothetical protein CAPTEDRAFT_194160 [Capitella teleta]|eukprot:ELT97578.1 hypothetical protein CAPTEDRAFT_207973 [Capitella teleta]
MAQWMSDNKLKLNDNNSKVIVFNPSNTGTPEHFRTFSICGTDIATKTSVKDLGVYFERNLSIEQQVKAICASCYFHLANIGALRNSDKRIEFKLCVLTWKALHDQATHYLYNILTFYSPERNLRSIDQRLLNVPSARTQLGRRAFQHSF